ncbi:MAG: hypothetical protein P4M11_07005 [Candidatus Pacebacteria bacterium]|nr:hypothetical protein [Candidatus Paceibacterota bacterium]
MTEQLNSEEDVSIGKRSARKSDLDEEDKSGDKGKTKEKPKRKMPKMDMGGKPPRKKPAHKKEPDAAPSDCMEQSRKRK